MTSITLPLIALVVIVATVIDLRTRRIPNWLVFPCLLAGLVWASVTHGWSGLGQALLGVGVAVLAVGPFCALRAMGMGDLKLCAAVGAWIGPSQLVVALVLTGMAGGVIALFIAICGGFLPEVLRKLRNLVFPVRQSNAIQEAMVPANPVKIRTMAYAPAIAIGTLLSFLNA